MEKQLASGAIYLGDNGEAICLHCAGNSALYTGRDISGQPVLPLTREDAKQGGVRACECGRTQYSVLTLTVNSREDEMPENFHMVRGAFNAKSCGSMRGMHFNDGLLKRDGVPIAQFSQNGRLWATEEFEAGHYRPLHPSESLTEIPAP